MEIIKTRLSAVRAILEDQQKIAPISPNYLIVRIKHKEVNSFFKGKFRESMKTKILAQKKVKMLEMATHIRDLLKIDEGESVHFMCEGKMADNNCTLGELIGNNGECVITMVMMEPF